MSEQTQQQHIPRGFGTLSKLKDSSAPNFGTASPQNDVKPMYQFGCRAPTTPQNDVQPKTPFEAPVPSSPQKTIIPNFSFGSSTPMKPQNDIKQVDIKQVESPASMSPQNNVKPVGITVPPTPENIIKPKLPVPLNHFLDNVFRFTSLSVNVDKDEGIYDSQVISELDLCTLYAQLYGKSVYEIDYELFEAYNMPLQFVKDREEAINQRYFTFANVRDTYIVGYNMQDIQFKYLSSAQVYNLLAYFMIIDPDYRRLSGRTVEDYISYLQIVEDVQNRDLLHLLILYLSNEVQNMEQTRKINKIGMMHERSRK